jgi:excisionase family DNA binding protein
MASERTLIEGWPTLMITSMAAHYLSLDEDTFSAIAIRNGVRPVEVTLGEVRWKRSDLDGLVRRLPSVQQPYRAQRAVVELGEETVAQIAAAISNHLSGRPTYDHRGMVSIKETIEMLGVGRSTIYRLIGEGQLQTRHIGRRTLVSRASIDALFAGKRPVADE